MELYVVLAVCYCVLQVVVSEGHLASASAVQVSRGNFEELRSKDILLLNFYADWCRFSQALKPIFDKAAETLQSEEPERVALGKVNCDAEKEFCSQQFHITKYPTVKIVRYGETARREYRGQRSSDALVDYVRQQLSDPIKHVAYHEITEKKAVVGYFSTSEESEYRSMIKVAINLRDDCPFFAVGREPEEAPRVVFKVAEEGVPDVQYPGDLLDSDGLHTWARDQCIPMVREITFQNGEEMTEEGLPLLIMFYHPDRPEAKEHFKQRVMEELMAEKGSINPVMADGVMFAHPLHHLGKARKDLPVLAIDSFRHMFVFPTYEDINIPGRLKQFVADLHSGKLHREFHHGPDAETPALPQAETAGSRDKRAAASSPPESEFRKLGPTGSRYSFLSRHDEL